MSRYLATHPHWSCRCNGAARLVNCFLRTYTDTHQLAKKACFFTLDPCFLAATRDPVVLRCSADAHQSRAHLRKGGRRGWGSMHARARARRSRRGPFRQGSSPQPQSPVKGIQPAAAASACSSFRASLALAASSFASLAKVRTATRCCCTARLPRQKNRIRVDYLKRPARLSLGAARCRAQRPAKPRSGSAPHIWPGSAAAESTPRHGRTLIRHGSPRQFRQRSPHFPVRQSILSWTMVPGCSSLCKAQNAKERPEKYKPFRRKKTRVQAGVYGRRGSGSVAAAARGPARPTPAAGDGIRGAGGACVGRAATRAPARQGGRRVPREN